MKEKLLQANINKLLSEKHEYKKTIDNLYREIEELKNHNLLLEQKLNKSKKKDNKDGQQNN
jgi:cell shape-determining protein MreC